MDRKETQIGVRVDPEFRAQIKAEANRRFGGNESLVLREATRVYLRLRRKLGHQYEPTLGLLCGDGAETDSEAIPA